MSTDGFVLDSVEIESAQQTIKAIYIISDTRMQIRLPEPLKGHGGQLKIHIQYHYQIPGCGYIRSYQPRSAIRQVVQRSAARMGEDAWDRDGVCERHSGAFFLAMVPLSNGNQRSGLLDGMEYPGIVFDGIKDKGAFLFWVYSA